MGTESAIAAITVLLSSLNPRATGELLSEDGTCSTIRLARGLLTWMPDIML
jgi:hypothetical protein